MGRGKHNKKRAKGDKAPREAVQGGVSLSQASALVDGSYGEGGGQILRSCVAASCILGIDVRVVNIRANRPRGGGLRPQHLCGIETVARMYGAHLTGGSTGSSEISLKMRPGAPRASFLTADTRTAGSCCLLAQILFPCALFSPSPVTMTLRGGTNAIKAPPADYLREVFLPFVARHMRVVSECRIARRGFYPKGGGEVVLSVQPVRGELPAFQLVEQGVVERVEVHIFYSSDRQSDYERATSSDYLSQALQDRFGEQLVINTTVDCVKGARDSCSGVMLVAHTSTGCIFGPSQLGEGNRNSTLQEMTQAAFQDLCDTLEGGWATVDEHLQDQLVILCALARGTSVYRCSVLTLHTQTVLHLLQGLTGARMTVTRDSKPFEYTNKDEKGAFEIQIRGIAKGPPE